MRQILVPVAALVLSVSPLRADDAVPDGVKNLVGTQIGVPAAERVLRFGEALLGVPYSTGEFDGGPFGEGPSGRYDRMPLSRFDAFDCTTFVETVTALSITDSWDDFAATLNRIRYKNGEISFVARNHFTDLDWIPNNVQAGFYKDVTESVAPGRTLIARAVVDKRAWYERLTIKRVQIPGASVQEREKLLAELRAEGRDFEPREATVPYIPLTALFGPGGDELFDRIPSGAVVNIVRPNWDVVDKIGTRMNISHQGFAARKDGVLYFMEASEVLHKVAMIPMADYFRAYRDSPTIKGINVLQIAK